MRSPYLPPMNDFIVVVPARLGSRRFPNKILADIHGTPMIIAVLQRAKQSGASRVYAAVDDAQVFQLVQDAGFEAVMTGEHDSGSARVAQVARDLALAEDATLVNVQGDEPLIDPELLNRLAQMISDDVGCASAAAPLAAADADDPNVVKVIVDANNRACYFSRAPIPHCADEDAESPYLAHIGVYAYRMDLLQRMTRYAPSVYEKMERLEQLRLLWHGERIAIAVTEHRSPGVDTPADLEKIRDLTA